MSAHVRPVSKFMSLDPACNPKNIDAEEVSRVLCKERTPKGLRVINTRLRMNLA